MDEAALAKGLEGKFFWEKTTRLDPEMNSASAAIRNAQSAFRPRETTQSNPEPKRMGPEDIERLLFLRAVVAREFGVTEKQLLNRSTYKHTATPKNFLMWASTRYFPDISLAKIGVVFGRHYTTVIHGRDTFELEKHLHWERIERVDMEMGRVSSAEEE